MNALISVIVPIYNTEKYLEKCLKSIIYQTYTQLEIILVDDGSGDNSGKICDEFAKLDSRIRVIHQVNGGSVKARKVGLEAAQGSYIGFVDSDDYIEKNMFEKLYLKMVEQNVDFVHSGYINGGKKIYGYDEERVSFYKTDRMQFLEEEILKGPHIQYGLWSKLFKAELIKKVFLQIPDEYSYGEDMICLCGCIMECEYLFLYRAAFYHYQVRENSLSHLNMMDFCARESLLYIGLKNLLKKYTLQDGYKENLQEYFKPRLIQAISLDKINEVKIARYRWNNILCLKGKRIVIYGAGVIGQGYYSQISLYTNCRIVAWIDKDFMKYDSEWIRVAGPHELKKLEFDILLVAVKKEAVAAEIVNELEELGIKNIRLKAVWEEPVKIW